jgi:hypothetical protein
MQYREQGRKVQVLAYRGFDKAKKRPIVKMLGSFDRYGYGLSDGLMDALTVEEKTDLTSYIETLRQSDASLRRQYALRSIIQSLIEASAAIEAGDVLTVASKDQALQAKKAMRRISRAITKALAES